MNILQEIRDAEQRIRPHILKTPLMESKELGKIINGKVYLKLESEQHTGSFKARGSLNKLLSLNDENRAQGTITASTGNHALGYARALEITGINGSVYLPENASEAKLKALGEFPVELRYFGTDCLKTELHAKQAAMDENRVWVSPYNDPQIIGGQGTVGLEITEQLDHVDDVLVTIGGGGLIAGTGTYVKSVFPDARIIGCEPKNSCEMTLSLDAGKVVDMDEELDTLSDASAGGIEPDSITFGICQNVIDDTILVEESHIADAVKFMAHIHHKMIEGAAGVAIASLVQNPEKFEGRTVVIVICGSNISMEKFKSLI